jgi:RNA polymerase sigma-70 factor (ECF subfamily)
MASASDSELMQLARDGDRNAFGVLVRRHQKRIYRLAVHMLRNPSEAEDVTQETFARAYQALQRFEGSSQPYTWLYRIAVNLSLNIIRARKPRQQTAGDDDPRVEAWMAQRAPDNTGDPSKALEQMRLAVALTAGIDQLSETLRTTLLVVCVEGLAHGDAAQVLGCPEGTIAWRVHEARRKLREHLASHGFDPTPETEP